MKERKDKKTHIMKCRHTMSSLQAAYKQQKPGNHHIRRVFSHYIHVKALSYGCMRVLNTWQYFYHDLAYERDEYLFKMCLLFIEKVLICS